MPINYVMSNSGVVNCGSGSTINNLDTQGGGGLSFSIWALHRTAGAASFGLFLGKVQSEAALEGFWEFYLDNSTSIVTFKKQDVTTNVKRTTNTGTTSANVWHNYVSTWDGGLAAANIHIYVDGIEATYSITTDGVGIFPSDASVPFVIGNLGNYIGSFDGFISEVALWNVVLTLPEAKQLALSRVKYIPLQVRPSALKAYYPIDNFSELVVATGGSTVQDRTANGNYGTPLAGVGGGANKGSAEQVLSYQP